MSEENLTKKEIYDLDKNEERSKQANAHKIRSTRRSLMWVGLLVVLVAVVWGMIKLSSKSAEVDEQITISGVTAEDWVKGNKDSGVVLIEYSDFQCPACGVYYPLVKKLIDEHKDIFQFAYRHFPLQQHANAKPASYAAEAAGKQGKFWEMHDLIFVNQNDWSNSKNADDIFLQYAISLGLDPEQFKQDRDSQGVKDKVERDYNSGVSNKVNATPTFFLNGKKIQPRNYEEFLALIEQVGSVEKK